MDREKILVKEFTDFNTTEITSINLKFSIYLLTSNTVFTSVFMIFQSVFIDYFHLISLSKNHFT